MGKTELRLDDLNSTVKQLHFKATNQEVTVAGNIETEVVTDFFPKFKSPSWNIMIENFISRIWNTLETATTYLKIYINDEETPKLTFSTTGTAKVIKKGSINIGYLSEDIHIIRIKMYSSDPSSSAKCDCWVHVTQK